MFLCIMCVTCIGRTYTGYHGLYIDVNLKSYLLTYLYIDTKKSKITYLFLGFVLVAVLLYIYSAAKGLCVLLCMLILC